MDEVKNEIVFDIFESIGDKSPLVSRGATELFQQAAEQVGPKTRVEIIVWAITPGPTSWNRAVHDAKRLRQDLINRTGVGGTRASMIKATGKPWFFSDEKRPRYSIVVVKLK